VATRLARVVDFDGLRFPEGLACDERAAYKSSARTVASRDMFWAKRRIADAQQQASAPAGGQRIARL